MPLPEAVREARRRFPSSHAKRLQINERENRRLAPADALVVQYEARGAVPTNAPQTMPALHTQAPVHGLLPGHQFRAFERPLRLLHRIRRSLKQGPF